MIIFTPAIMVNNRWCSTDSANKAHYIQQAATLACHVWSHMELNCDIQRHSKVKRSGELKKVHLLETKTNASQRPSHTAFVVNVDT